MNLLMNIRTPESLLDFQRKYLQMNSENQELLKFQLNLQRQNLEQK